jgi:hypothetical protein
MADFGLAAQIGRGNAMPGAQQQDPQNRMMQMMQLQQLQQNMMLAREQNAREAALAPLREGQLRASTQADEALTPGRQAQSKVYQLALGDKETEQRTYKGFLDVMDRMAKGTFNPADPAAFRDLDPAVRLNVQKQLAESSVTAAAAKKAGIELGGVERAVTYDMLGRAGVGITGPREFQSFRDKIVKVTPEADEFLPRYFNPKTAQDLVAFVGSQVANIEKIGDVPYLRIGSSPTVQELTVVPAGAAPPQAGRDTVSLPAGVQPPTRAQIGQFTPAEYGGVLATPQMGMDPARLAAGTPADVGAMQSGVPGQRLPVAGGANFQSLASAGGPIPASQAIAEQAKAKSSATKMEALPKVQSAYKATVDSIDKQLRAIEEIESRPIGTYFATGPIAGSSFNPARVLPGDVLGVQGAQAQINNLKASGTLTALTELRRNSPNGSALGNSSDRDAEILDTSDSALSQAQSTEDFMRAVQNKKRDLLLAKSRLGEAYASDYGAPPKVEGGPLSKELVRSGDTSVLLPNGKTLNFPSKDAVDAYMKKAGM